MAFNSKLDQVLTRFFKLHPKLIDLSLSRITRLLKKLGNPEDHLPPIIHVAGTNGKGSTIAFIRSILECANYRPHVYSSPHLVNFNERILLAGNTISDHELLKLLENVEKINAGEPITFFEITTAAAFVAFASTKADIALIETGLGGRLDTTNVVKNPLLSILTPIHLDHQNFLGNTVAKIAREKAGIIKPGHTCIVAKQQDLAMQSILAHSQEVGSALYVQDEDWSIKTEKNKINYSSARSKWTLPLPNLLGDYQVNNCGLALAALERCPSFVVSKQDISNGIQSTKWPGRMHRLMEGPLLTKLPNGYELWLDGGHNPHAGEALAKYISNSWQDKPFHMICGMIKSKDCNGYLCAFANLAHSVQTVTIPNQVSSIEALELTRIALKIGIKATPTTSVKTAIHHLVSNYSYKEGRILICGSLYLAGVILQENR